MDIRTLCLGILTFGDATGYTIKKRLEGPLRHFYDASFGSIYPALRKLTDAGEIVRVHGPATGGPDRKTYSITQAGRLALIEALQDDIRPDRYRSDLMVALLFADLLAPSHIDRLIEERVAFYRASIDQIERCTDPETPGQEFVNGLGLAIYRAALDYFEENRHALVGEALLSQSPPRRAGHLGPDDAGRSGKSQGTLS
jgi:PadR family transcriptional regulator AphA